MQFLMLVMTAGDAEPDPSVVPSIEDWGSYVDAHGHWIAGDRLRPEAEARTVRVRNGQTLVNPGPVAGMAEQIVGFDVLECADVDEALEIAKRHPNAHTGQLELRPFWPLSEN